VRLTYLLTAEAYSDKNFKLGQHMAKLKKGV